MPSFRSGRWDGTYSFLNLYRMTFPSGLIDILPPKLREKCLIVDARRQPAEVSEDALPQLRGIELRDYQLEMIREGLKRKRCVLMAPTNSGKTELAAGIISVLQCRTLFLTHLQNLAEQTRERLENRLGCEVGVIFADRWEPKKITVGMIPTLYQRLKSKSERVREYLWENVDCLFLDECLDGDTQIATPNGMVLLRELRVGDTVLTPDGVARVKRKWKTKAPAFKYVLSGENSYLIASANHIVPTFWSGKGITLKPISQVDRLLVLKHLMRKLPYDEDEYMLGWILGDGTNDRGYIKFAFRKDVDEIREIFRRHRCAMREYTNARGDTIFALEREDARRLEEKYDIPRGRKTETVEIPKELYEKCSVGVIKGLFDAEGHSPDNRRICVDMTSEKCVRQLSDMLKVYGVWNTVYRYRRRAPHRDRWRLAIYGEYVHAFNSLFGFELKRKQFSRKTRYNRRGKFKEEKIREVISLGERELYDIELDDEDRLFIANGIVVHNCHHLTSQSWLFIARRCNAYFRYGMSATPVMRDAISNLQLIGQTGGVVGSITNADLIERGISAKPIIYVVENRTISTDLERKTYHAAYRLGIETNFDRNLLIAKIVSEAMKRGESTLVLTNTVKHQTSIFWTLSETDAGVRRVRLLHGGVDVSERMKALKDLRRGRVGAIVATPIFDEGMDVPEIRVLVLAGGGKSQIKLLQRVGRGMRRKTTGDNVVKIYDFLDVGNKYLASHARRRISVYEQQGFEVQHVTV